MSAIKKIRILFIAPSFDILGGQTVQADRLMRRLREEPNTEIGFLPINPRLPGPLSLLQKIKYVRTIVTSLAYYLGLLVKIRQYDIIHIFSASYISFILSPTPAILIGKLFRKKLLLNYHSGEAEDHLQRWRRSAIPTIQMVDEVVVPSKYLVHVFSNFGIKCKPIFNLIERDSFQFRKRDPLQPVFLSNRNFEAHYGIDKVLNAFSIIQKRIPEARLLVVGDGSQRDALHQLASDLALKQVTFLGRVEHERANEIYNSADVFLNGSSIDNQPLSILEAFACGLPVVTSNAGGIPYMVEAGKTALLVPVGDAEALAVSALSLFENCELVSRLVTNGLSECRNYEWEVLRGQWLNTYYRMMGLLTVDSDETLTNSKSCITSS
jgi:glycosyltransferase involved in cell wall biosynthesis